VCCSDGRWREQVEEFVHARVSARADLHAVPGGPATFDLLGAASLVESWMAERVLRFLAEHHPLRWVWLVVHEGCAYYLARYGPLDVAELGRKQDEDLVRARNNIRRWRPELRVLVVRAALEDGRAVFTWEEA
jgi:hypothetical protein